MSSFIRGAIAGLAIAAPVGPIGALCIARTIARGFAAGLFTGLGAAAADAVYATLAALTLGGVTTVLAASTRPLHLAGAALLAFIGLRTIASSTSPPGAREHASVSAASDALSTFALTLLNPATILSFAAVVAAAGLVAKNSSLPLLVAGVFFGSVLWWLVLSGTMAILRRRLTPVSIRRIGDASGGLLVAFAVVLLL
jgi:putative LysE/RhtB family amino acid efflux pump